MGCCDELIDLTTAGTQGPIGPQGATGAQGPAGADGTPGDTFSTTSSNSLTIGTGSQSFTVQSGLAYVPAQPIILSYDGSNYMNGTITSYNRNTGAVVVNITSVTGAGTYSSWNLALAGLQGPPGPTGLTGATGATGAPGAAGPQGIQGIQGIQGPAGANGINGTNGVDGADGITYYPYVAYASDNAGTNFNTNPSLVTPKACYMNLLFSTSTIGTLTLGNFVIGGSVTWVSGWIKICGEDGTIVNTGGSTFTSGSGAPSGVSTNGTVYFDTSNGVFYVYNGGWSVIPFAYTVSGWQSITSGTMVSPYTVVLSNTAYRQQGVEVTMRGGFGVNTSIASAGLITTDALVFTFPAGYRPTTVSRYVHVYDNFSGIWGVGRIDTNGNFYILGTKMPIDNRDIRINNVKFEIS